MLSNLVGRWGTDEEAERQTRLGGQWKALGLFSKSHREPLENLDRKVSRSDLFYTQQDSLRERGWQTEGLQCLTVRRQVTWGPEPRKPTG